MRNLRQSLRATERLRCGRGQPGLYLAVVLALLLPLVGACASPAPAPAATAPAKAVPPTATTAPSTAAAPTSPAVAPAPTTAPAPAAAQPIKLTFSSFLAVGTAQGIRDKYFLDQVEQKTGGRVKFERFWSEALIKNNDALPSVAKGVADVGFIGPAYFPSQLPLTSVLELPYVTNAPDAQIKAGMEMYEKSEAFRQEYEKSGVKMLYFHPVPATVLGAKKPVQTAADLRGLKIRAHGGTAKVVEANGATVVGLSSPETYEGLQRGVVDAFTGVTFNLSVALKLHELTPYYTDPGIGMWASGGTVVSLESWKKLPDDVKKVFDDVSKEMLVKGPQVDAEQDRAALENIKSAGKKIEMYVLPQSEQESWKSKVIPRVWDEWVTDKAKLGVPAKDVLELYRTTTKKYEAQTTYKSPFEIWQKEYKQ